jgi:hypothetical protein
MRTLHQSPWIIALAIGCLLFAASANCAESYHDSYLHFSLQLPDGWTTMSPDALARINETVRRRMPRARVSYDAGFQPKGEAPGSYPYIVVQWHSQKTAGRSLEDIESDLSRGFARAAKRVEGRARDVAKNFTVGDIAVDPSKNRIIMRVEMDVSGVGKVQGLSVGTIGAEGIVYLHCYARESDFERDLPAFDSIADSFQYDPGFAFTPGTLAISWWLSWMPNLGGTLIGVLLGALVLIAACAALIFYRRHYKQPQPGLPDSTVPGKTVS